MDRKKMMQVLVPALAAAAMVVLVGVLVAMSSWSDTPPSAKGKGGAVNSTVSDMSDKGMSDSLPPLDAPEWKALPDGMRTWDVVEGEGDPCPVGATVTIHYTGWTTDGTVFDSSRRRGEATTFPLANLIKGWQEGIPGMRPGGIRRLDIPYPLAYGEYGKPPSIPAKAQLVFEVKLIAFK